MRQEFLEGMSRAACTVSIVTTNGAFGRAGVTVSAMSSVSADSPAPSLLVCVHHLSPAAQAIIQNGVFCVNVLRDDQALISDVFAGRIKTASGDKFEAGAWRTGKTGAPALADALVAFDCHLKLHFQYGSHCIFIGELAGIDVHESGTPLVYANRAYGVPVGLGRYQPAQDFGREAGERLRIGVFITLGPYVMPALMARFSAAHPGIYVELAEGDQDYLKGELETGGVACALLYDMELGGRFETELLAEIPSYALLPADHPLGGREDVRLSDLVHEPLVLLDVPPSRDYFLSLFREVGLEPRIGYRSRSFETVRGLVGHGFGYSILGTKPANAMTYDGRALALTPLADEVSPSRLVVARPRRACPDQRKADLFVEQCRAFFHLKA